MWNILRFFFKAPSVKLAIHWPSLFNLKLMRKLNKVQLSPEQLKLISSTINKNKYCCLLVFGLGNDSLYWSNLNKKGTTIFLEDNEGWLKVVTKRVNGIRAFLVKFDSQRKDWKILLNNPSSLAMILPPEVKEIEWDVILVDAPSGVDDKSPGRMKSIFTSSELIKKNGDIFIHDCDREVERIYSTHFLKEENLKVELKAPPGIGYLRHYNMAVK